MSPIRITRIIARLNIGGPAVHIANLTAGLDAARFESRLITGRPGPHEGDMGYLIEEKGLAPPIVLPELGRSLHPLYDFVTVVRLVRVLRQQRPHIVETHTAKAGFVGRVAAWLVGVPVVLHVFHGHVFRGYFGALPTRAFIALERLLARWTDRVITISPAQRHDIAHVYRIAPSHKVDIVPLGVDLRPFVEARSRDGDRLRAELGIALDAPLIGYVGRLTAIKNPALFLDVAQRVLQSTPGARFLLVGDGELRPDVERQLASLGLSERVFLVGWQKDMPPVYAALDALVLSSLNEGTPMTAIEAMAARVPVVATAVGGVPDLVADGRTGLLAPSGDAESLAKHLLCLLHAPEQARSVALAGQRDVLARFAVERLVRDMEALYVTLLAEKEVRV